MTSKKKWAKIDFEMSSSVAFQNLNASALKILVFVHTQLNRSKTKSGGKIVWSLVNRNKLYIPYRELSKEPYNMKPPTVSRAIDSLLAKGFLKVVVQGGRQKGHPSVFGLCDKYLTWVKGDVINKRRPFVGKGFCSK